ncbi:complex I 24 kDa subunit family protein [Clostridium grantii]|uniref:NAD(P)-dependent iron-only hydrogenase diaphorase component iron-sulfur protein n=1 Tax=Clostridium grantii DSM 8605 TaxID=1121316 RepID=A0A1M5UKJ1_9CLOT|nr:NAD(P)H-dependent oxidoreductase subunit E [Clostridium grantii]SHH63524.1 NAD(P)-dependent iron-only hydrogenase diaphorase component iron-sulfur protein [Clostridium grantii DSM 8605]
MCSNELVKEKFDELEKFINEMPDKQGALIEVLHKAQNIFGYLPEEVQRFVSKQLNIPVSKIFGVITFYSYFTTEPKGEHVISICMGTACFVKGAGEIVKEFEKQLGIKAGETTPDGKFTIDVLRCIGACGLAPVLTVNERVIGHVTTAAQVKNILKEY